MSVGAWCLLSCSWFAQHSLGALAVLTMEFLWHLEAVLARPETFPGSSSDPARCEVASCVKGFETQLNFDMVFAMVLVFVFNFVPRKAELLFLVAKLTESHWLEVKCGVSILCFVVSWLLV